MVRKTKPIPEFYRNIFETVYDVFGETAEEVVYGLSLHLEAEVLRKAITDLEAISAPYRILRLQECLEDRYVDLLSSPPNDSDVEMFLTQLNKALKRVQERRPGH